MPRLVLIVVLVFMFLTVLRGLRIFLAAFLKQSKPAPGSASARRAAASRSAGALEGEMVRDPVCGTWIDRRLAVPARRAGESISVCSEKCRAAFEAEAQAR